MIILFYYEILFYLLKIYDGWVNRKMIDFYENYVCIVFNCYKGKVKYWFIFNEINFILYVLFMSGGIFISLDKLF